MISLREMSEAGFVGHMPQESTKSEVRNKQGRVLVSRENRRTVGDITIENPRMTCRNVNVFYGNKQAIKDVSMDVGRNEVVAMIGPSGCGKSTFLRCLNRMNDTIEGCRISGEIALDGVDIYGNVACYAATFDGVVHAVEAAQKR